MTRHRGLALILVLGALSLLALLAAAFSTLATAERQTSRAFLDGVRARLAAESGVQAAVARLRERMALGTLWKERSWSVASPDRVRLDGEEIDDAGFLGAGAYAAAGDLYRVRIRDAQGALHLNEGVEGGPNASASRNLARMLDLLGAQPGVRAPRLGERLLKARPPAGFASLFDVEAALDGDRELFERVRPFLTVRAWQDPGVANPVPFSPETLAEHPVAYARPRGPAGPLLRHGADRPITFDPPGNAVHGRDTLFPGWIETVSRAPVNVNTAPREVLAVLITDLQGIYLSERRRAGPPPPPGRGAAPPCVSPGSAYAWNAVRYDYAGDGEEAMFLTRTRPFTGPGGRHAAGIPAAAVVEEILACRERRRSPGVPGLDYAAASFGGPFGAWAQFHRFVDALVDGGLIADPDGPVASRAAGDVLKANFDPNLHLNELNPDRILLTLVDKTDLLTASAEFCFTPMGIFAIESAGHVVEPEGDGLRTLARREVHAVVRLFDAVRLGAQRDFQAGDISLRRGPVETNNNRSLEAGPEPDNGDAPSANGAEGWLRLSTYGAVFKADETKPKGELRTTLSDGSFYPAAATSPPGGPHLGSSMHAHFQLDHAAHHHGSRNGMTWPRYWDGFRTPQGAWQAVFGNRMCLARNRPDRGETLPGPYGPVEGARIGEPGRHRLVRSWSGEPPEAAPTAPSDLRLDGAYVERDSAFGWWIDENVSFNVNEGVAAFWMKPAFDPALGSKRRTLLSAGRYHAERPEIQNPSPFGLYFLPPGFGREDVLPTYAAGLAGFRPASLAFGFGFSPETGYNWEFGGEGPAPETAAGGHAFTHSPTLNHEGHGCGRSSLLRAGEWIHVGVAWSLRPGRRTTADSARVYVNGRVLPDTAPVTHRFVQAGEPFLRTPGWSVHSLQATAPGRPQAGWLKNLIRLGGEPTMLFEGAGAPGPFPGNYSADATFDEFYLWMDRSPRKGGGVGGLQELWARGRYYRPDDGDPEDARFTSAPIALAHGRRRSAPGAERTADPGPRVLGISWTERTPDLADHAVLPPRPLAPEGGVVEAGLFVGAAWHGPLRDPVFSPLPIDTRGEELRVTLKLKAGANASSILLASPVVDDLTVFVETESAGEFLGWVLK